MPWHNTLVNYVAILSQRDSFRPDSRRRVLNNVRGHRRAAGSEQGATSDLVIEGRVLTGRRLSRLLK